jgi:hypothetical protein
MARLSNLTFACADPLTMATFWAAALGYEVEVTPEDFARQMREAGRDPDDGAAASDPSGVGPRLFFLRKEKRPAVDGTSTPLHLDLQAKDRAAEVARLVALGATVVSEESFALGDFTHHWTELQDPEGNGFCVQ